uniref:Uncharacterized protein n=1 Tax=Trichogramma kaykai TaxID=54128 RepID=A0ABD2W156_9HYME
MQSFIERKDTRDGDLKLKQPQRDLNESQNATTGKSPFEALYGFTASHNERVLRELSEIELSYDPNHTQRIAELGANKNRYLTTAHSSQLKLWEPHADEHDEVIYDDKE